MIVSALVYMAVTGHPPLMGGSERPAQVGDLGDHPGDEFGETTLQQVVDLFGPWHIRVDDEDVPQGTLLLLHQNGAVEVSSTTVEFKPAEWQSSHPFTLQEVSVHGNTAEVRTNQQHTFTVDFDQPFVLEQEPNQAHLVHDDGTVYSTPIQQLRPQPSSETTT